MNIQCHFVYVHTYICTYVYCCLVSSVRNFSDAACGQIIGRSVYVGAYSTCTLCLSMQIYAKATLLEYIDKELSRAEESHKRHQRKINQKKQVVQLIHHVCIHVYICVYLCGTDTYKSFIQFNAMLFMVRTLRGVMNSLDGVPADHMHQTSIHQLLPTPALYGILLNLIYIRIWANNNIILLIITVRGYSCIGLIGLCHQLVQFLHSGISTVCYAM